MFSSLIRFAIHNGTNKNLIKFNLINSVKKFEVLSSSIGLRQFSSKKADIDVTFIKASGDKINVKGKEGETLLDVVVNNNLDLDGFGACEGTLTCSTCHLILKKDDFERLPDKPGDEELDMLDLAYELTDTSRLGCQITLTKELNGLEVQVPSTVNDARS